MRLIDADALRKHFEVPHELKCGIQAGMDEYALKCIDEQPTIAASPWHRVEEPPEPHKKVLVSGMEAINNSRVYKVMVNDNGEWRPKDYAPSILWDYWMPIEPPKEEKP